MYALPEVRKCAAGGWLLITCILIGACADPVLTGLRTWPPHVKFPIPTAGGCAGHPGVNLTQVAGAVSCIGLVDSQLVFPRGVATLGDDVLVVDKGSDLASRFERKGSIYRYRSATDLKTRDTLLTGLYNPSGIAVWQSRYVFISTPNQVLRVDPHVTPVDVAVAIDKIPTPGWHYLTAIYIHQNWLYLTVPSATDHCESGQADEPQVQYPCGEQETAVLRRYRINDQGQVSADFEFVARGLRDALAMVAHTDQPLLYAADNGWDHVYLSNTEYDPAHTPHDEVNVINMEAATAEHFGWPYCFDATKITPPYADQVADCQAFTAPALLLPPHAAPLGMAWVDGALWLNLHGYRAGGQQTVRVGVDKQGAVNNAFETMILWDYRPHNGYGIGRPFGITALNNDTLLITDDWNGALLQVVLNPDR